MYHMRQSISGRTKQNESYLVLDIERESSSVRFVPILKKTNGYDFRYFDNIEKMVEYLHKEHGDARG